MQQSTWKAGFRNKGELYLRKPEKLKTNNPGKPKNQSKGQKDNVASEELQQKQSTNQ